MELTYYRKSSANLPSSLPFAKALDIRSMLRYKNAVTRWGNSGSKQFERYSLSEHGVMNPKAHWNITKRVSEYSLNTPYLMGFELEIETEESKNGEIGDYSSRLSKILSQMLPKSHYVCWDGSLDNGLEIVSAPLSKPEHRQNFHRYYQGLKELRDLGMISHDSDRCGLHIHVSKRALPREKWLKLKRFLSANRDFFKAVSRRTDGQLRWCAFKRSDGPYCSRGWALNLEPDHTAEFRFFRGTLKFNSFILALELVMSLVDYARSTERLNFKAWYKFMSENKYKCDRDLIQSHYDSYVQTLTPTVRSARTKEEREAARLKRFKLNQARIIAAISQVEELARRSQVVQRHSAIVPTSYGWQTQYVSANEAYERVTLPVRTNSFGVRVRRIVNEEVRPFVQAWISKEHLPRFQATRPELCVSRTSAWGHTRTHAQLINSSAP